MAGVVKVLVALVLLSAAVSMAVDPKGNPATDSLVWTALLSKTSHGMFSRRGFDPLLDLDPVGLMQYFGYHAENHFVTTEDGYILGIHRMFGPRNEFANADKARPSHLRRPAVILAHPLLSSSAEWIVAGPGRALAYLLADEGYDVWMLNVRGNTYSQNHTTMSPNDDAFWDFSFHEHGLYDMPALIEYVVRETGEQRLQVVGFSMGGGITVLMSSLRPDVAKRITLFTGLGPATSLVHSRSLTFRALAKAMPTLMFSSRAVHVHRFLPHTAALKATGEIFCSDGSLTQSLCTGLINALSGRNDAQMNETLLPYIISRTPSGASFKTMNHYGQSMENGFRFYDYGKSENVRRYGTATAPKYNVSSVFVPTRIHYGLNDHLSDYKDVQELCAQLPMLISCDAVSDPLWTHLNFVWGIHARDLVYNRVIADMKQANAAA